MKEKLGTIFGAILLVAIIGGMIHVNVVTEKSNGKIISEIILEGDKILSANDYLISSDLNKVSEYTELTLQQIKSRITQHPYVAKAEVQGDGMGRVNINIVEKNFMAVLLSKSDPFLITENFQLIKMKRNSDISKLPVISNSTLSRKSDDFGNIHGDELVRAFKIIDASKIVNHEMYNRLTEINLRHGGDVILRFSGITFPVIFGKGLEGKKVVVLSSIWNGLNEKDILFKNSSYVDLRFNNEIFIGKPVNTESNG
jgi:cell division septal protein FtsQ